MFEILSYLSNMLDSLDWYFLNWTVEPLSNLRNSFLVYELQTFIECVSADNASQSSMHHDTAHARIDRVLAGLVEFREELL